MNKIVIAIGTVFICCLLPLNVIAANWLKIIEDSYFDASRISITKPGAAVVWIKDRMDQESIKKRLIQTNYKIDYTNYSHTLSEIEIDCNAEKMRTLSVYDYGVDRILQASRNPDSDFHSVIPESYGEYYLYRICPFVRAPRKK